MDTGANGHLAIWGKLALEKNGRNYKGITGAKGYLGHVIGQTRTFEADGHWWQMGTWGKWAPGKMSTRANRYLRQMGTMEHNGHLGTNNGHWG